jgi:hypothetical protein
MKKLGIFIFIKVVEPCFSVPKNKPHIKPSSIAPVILKLLNNVWNLLC